MSREEVDAVSDVVHALHAATGADVPGRYCYISQLHCSCEKIYSFHWLDLFLDFTLVAKLLFWAKVRYATERAAADPSI